MTKVKVAMDWLAACAGCEMSVLDTDERIVQLLEKIELTSTPITDLKHPPKEGVTVGILSGTVNNTTNLEVAKEMRERSKILIAMGDCAVFGGIMTMRNFFNMDEALKRAYVETESTVEGFIPNSEELSKPIKACPHPPPRLPPFSRRHLLRSQRVIGRTHSCLVRRQLKV
jgi:NAD-reducing hydrogenase small subunit